MPPTSADFNTHLDAIKDLMDAKFEGVDRQLGASNKVLERLVSAVERQTETNIQVAILQESHNHLKGNVMQLQAATANQFHEHSKRIKRVESATSHNKWRLDSGKALWSAIGGGVMLVLGFLADHLDKIVAVIHGA